ncbi:DUF6228 family protein [Actinoplanes sp. NPDC023801]|uniref:DUF6228 family protein n=1 Tax=Actinoplanes sp. NPDC023801 TaxID=3154595 RepID=UPI0033F55637
MAAATASGFGPSRTCSRNARGTSAASAWRADWRAPRGWKDVRTWHSLERELALDARHDGRGHVSLGVTLRKPGPDWDGTAWSARAVFMLEAGEEMAGFAADLTYVISTGGDPA